MKIISITGAHSGVGKTSLGALLLREIEGFSAIKVTKTELFTSITTEEDIISEKGKDSSILKEGGASKVIWIKSTQRDLKESLPQALSMLGDCKGVIIEGNSPLDFIEPDLIIFVMNEDLSALKPSGRKALEEADLVVINTESRDLEVLKARVMDINPGADIFSNDLTKGEIGRRFLELVMKKIGMEARNGENPSG
jgi:molybdopterin-guanine dinucleotide biosynthesis protein